VTRVFGLVFGDRFLSALTGRVLWVGGRRAWRAKIMPAAG
jgi:hypothetical protein